ncbi:hypothetical protein [Bhargavaea beijingensis]|uniref:hypothetical protein n=1 Tax=Bhargavaea beijingensis TaxID=426756 RepID=UPI000B825FE8|nr:hypothetical protein [Bhargavaea beijingensis]
MYRAFNFGLSLTIAGFVMIFLANIVSDAYLFGVESDINGFLGIFDLSSYLIPFTFIGIGLPFVVIIPLVWLSKWSRK